MKALHCFVSRGRYTFCNLPNVMISVACYTRFSTEKKAIWDSFGGSCWEISNFLGNFLNLAKNRWILNDEFNRLLEKKLILFRSMFVEYVTIESKKVKLLLKITDLIRGRSGKGFMFTDLRYLVDDNVWTVSALKDELNGLVRKNFLSYATPRAQYALQGRSMELGLEACVKMIEHGAGS